MKKKFLVVVATLLSLFVFVSCGGNKETTSGSGVVKDTIVVTQGSDAKSLDPHKTNDNVSSRVTVNIYDTLVDRTEDMKIVPLLAESYEQPDATTTIFHLRKGVKFHNGEELKASDVKFSLERALAHPQVSEIIEPIKSIETPDDYTVVIKTDGPFAPLLNHLAHPATAILNEKAVKEAGDTYAQHPVGTGPFKFVNWISGDKIELTANEEYFRGASKIKNIVFRNVPEQSSRVIGLETGEIDVIYDIEGLDKENVKKNEKFAYFEKPGLSMTYLGFNMKKAPFDNKLVRHAIAYGIDVKPIIDAVFQSSASVANSIIPPQVFAHFDGKSYEYNPEKAKELLAQAGFPNGLKTKLWINDSPVRRDIAVIVQDQLKQIGIDVEIETLEWGAYLDRTAAGEHDMFVLGWGTVTADPDYGMNALINTATQGAAGNRSFYSNPKVDELLKLGKATVDPEKRAAVYKEIQEIIQEDLPMYFICYPNQNAVMQKNIKGFALNSAGHHHLYGVYFE